MEMVGRFDLADGVRSPLDYVKAWDKLRELVELLDRSKCGAMTMRAWVILMDELLRSRDERVSRGLSGAIEVVVSDVIAYYDERGRLVGFEGLKELPIERVSERNGSKTRGVVEPLDEMRCF